MDKSSRPRRRARPPPKNVQQEPQPELPEIQTSQRLRQRRQSNRTSTQVENTSEVLAGNSVLDEESSRPRKGARPLKKLAETNNSTKNELDPSAPRRSKRKRTSTDGEPLASKNDAVRSEGPAPRVDKKRRRPLQPSNAQLDEQPEPGPGSETETTSKVQKKKARRDPSAQDGQPSETEPVLVRKKRGPPLTSATGNEIRDASSKPQKKAAPKNPHAGSKQAQSSRARQKSESQGQASGEQEQSPARPSSPESDSSLPPYRHIAERARLITRDVIDSKWSTLDPSSIANVANLLHAASQPTLQHVAPKQYTHAENVIEKVIKALCKRSGKLPFPPASTLPHREDELNFEQTQTAVELLLSQLDPLQHSVEVLRRAKDSAEKDLEREYKLLDRLSANARAEAQARRDQLKKLHDLVPESTSALTHNKSIHQISADQGAGQVFSGIQDEELLALAGQISNHMESMRGNLLQIGGVLPAIEESHALLRTTLQPHFGQKQLEHIFLGQAEP